MSYRPGQRLLAWVDSRLAVRPSPLGGRGFFACAPIAGGEILIRWGGVVFSARELEAGAADPDSVAVLAEGLYLGDPPGELLLDEYYLNHSCDPNLRMADERSLAARRPVAEGEELTADYALWLYGRNWTLEACRCGSPLCRGRVAADDWRRPELRERYRGHFTPFINALIAEGRGD